MESTTMGGYTTNTTSKTSYTTTGWSGSETIETLGPDGGIVVGPCSYSVSASM